MERKVRCKMIKFKTLCIGLTAVLMLLGIAATTTAYWENGEAPTFSQWRELKGTYDDPAPFMKGPGGDPKQYLPADIYKKVTFDINDMKKAWSDLVGFKAPDVVGKVSPDIKPGTYNYKDKDRYPGFKKLMDEDIYKRFNAGGPPHVGNCPEIKVVATKQHYWSLAIARASKENEGMTKQDDKGYLIQETYKTGFPFPRPSGPFKAQQILWNWYKRSVNGDNSVLLQEYFGWDKNLKRDYASTSKVYIVKLDGRSSMEPFGYIDERAQRRGENRTFVTAYVTPQDSAGNVISVLYYGGTDKKNAAFFYFNQIRRLRKLSAEDTQDPFPGGDVIMDDSEGLSQKLRHDLYPYDYKLIGETELLFPFTFDGSVYLSSSDWTMRDVEWERRPVYVLELIQKDPNYVYGRRILYIDRENFLLLYAKAYDQKGRLYRDMLNINAFLPDQGMFSWFATNARDHVDLHSTWSHYWCHPFAYWLDRDDINLGTLMRKGR